MSAGGRNCQFSWRLYRCRRCRRGSCSDVALAQRGNGTVIKAARRDNRNFEKARLFDMLVPTPYGGSPMLVAHLHGCGGPSRARGWLGRWTLALLSVGTWMATTFYAKPVVDEMHAISGSLRSGTVLAPGKVKTRSVDGGILIEEGLWSYNSGIHHAQWDNLGIPIHDEAGQFVGRGSALIPVSQITLLNDWDTFGLRGSGSTSVTVKDVFVPNERIALLARPCRKITYPRICPPGCTAFRWFLFSSPISYFLPWAWQKLPSNCSWKRHRTGASLSPGMRSRTKRPSRTCKSPKCPPRSALRNSS